MDYQVKLVFNDGVNEYVFPLVQNISDPIPGIKSTIIDGNRASGSLVIPGGKKSIEIIIRGVLLDNSGYEGLTDKINEMRTKVTTNIATLTLKHYTGLAWQNDWQYVVRRTEEIPLPESEDKRTSSQNYEVRFLVLSY